MDQLPRVGALAVLMQEDKYLLVQRGKEPGRGLWGFPGGHVEFGESVSAAAVRELREETGVIAQAAEHLAVIEVLAKNHHYVLAAVACDYVSGEAVAADDAAATAWVTLEEMNTGTLPLSDQVIDLALKAKRRDIPNQPLG